ncbi:hypothetical protein ACQR1W_18415 [Bradyrhizobium sp. HKCCYLS1011]|uniref:hypothetical protein n=1 Tax=Bradyrhizobium sp. HKCCYLS1011 TaxID=3420733 RepID=UPI003EBE3C66
MRQIACCYVADGFASWVPGGYTISVSNGHGSARVEARASNLARMSSSFRTLCDDDSS